MINFLYDFFRHFVQLVLFSLLVSFSVSFQKELLLEDFHRLDFMVRSWHEEEVVATYVGALFLPYLFLFIARVQGSKIPIPTYYKHFFEIFYIVSAAHVLIMWCITPSLPRAEPLFIAVVSALAGFEFFRNLSPSFLDKFVGRKP